MPNIETGRVVLATQGRDKGSYYVVTGEQDGRVMIADGRRRQLQRPKSKNPCHLAPTEYCLASELVTGNRRLRKLLAKFGQREEAKETVN